MDRRFMIQWRGCQEYIPEPLSLADLIAILRYLWPFYSIPCHHAPLNDLVVEPDLRQR